MKRKNMNLRMVKTMDEEVRIIGVCAECGENITDDFETYYCDEECNLLCSQECIMEHFGLYEVEV
jgi:hypothetical protein